MRVKYDAKGVEAKNEYRNIDKIQRIKNDKKIEVKNENKINCNHYHHHQNYTGDKPFQCSFCQRS